MKRKIYSPTQLRRLLSKKSGRKVLTGGCFDILHRGHIRHLSAARGLGDILIVAVDDDATIRRSKGRGHPYMPLRERMEILAALEFVNYVTYQTESTWLRWIAAIKPDLYVKGVDWRGQLPESERLAVTRHGGRIVFLGQKLDSSTRLFKVLTQEAKEKERLCASRL